MNDYAGTEHRVIFDMVKAGQFGSVNGYAEKLNGIRNVLGGHVVGLRERLVELGGVWSDGAGSDRMAADLGAVTDYLDVLAAGLSGQPSSYVDLVTQGAADLAAAQSPTVLPPPPPPGLDAGSLRSAQSQTLQAVVANPLAEPGLAQNVQASYDVKIRQAEAARQLAGETATTLDGHYRTLLARLTPPPEPPPLVSDAASTSPTASAAGGGSAGDDALMGGSAGRFGSSSGGAAGGALFGADSIVTGRIAAANSTSAPADWTTNPSTPAAGAAGSGSMGSVSPAVSIHGGWRGDAGLPGDVDVGVDASGVGTGPSGSGASRGLGGVGGLVGVGGGVGGVVGLGVGGVGGVAGWDEPAGSVPAQGLRGDPTASNGLWDGAGSTAGSVGSAQLAGTGAIGHAVSRGGEFDPISGAPVVAGAGQVGSVNGSGVSAWDVAGVGGLAALAGGALYLARGGAAPLSGAASLGGAAIPGGAAGTAGSGTGSGGVGSAGHGAGGPNPLVQGGQIGQSGRPAPGTAGYGSGRLVAPGASIGGGQQDARVTWLVEDRDLYGIGPSVAAVIEAPIDDN
ncbi:MAG: hypothetical protein ABWZ02_08495 [Nakamurella sp.]